MPIYLFCEGHNDFVRNVKTVEKHIIMKGLEVRRLQCPDCGHTWWTVDDFRGEDEDE